MRLDQMTVTLRVRSPWQAMDLGLRMVRANARAIWLPYFLLAGSFFVACNLLAYALDMMWLGWFLMWWLKPVFDRIPLHVLSHVTFGNHPGFREILRAPFQWNFGLWAAWLTYRRFSPWRSLSMPIDILEGLRTDRLSLRRSILIGAVSSQMIGLTFICIAFEWVLITSLFVLFYMFIPLEWLSTSVEGFFTHFFQNPSLWVLLIFNTVFFISMSVISPFFVGAGFAAYLNRRTQLEAWDIEIAFKRIAARLRQSGALVLLAAALFGGIAFSPPMQAQEITSPQTVEENVLAEDTAKTAPKSDGPPTLKQIFGPDYRAEPQAVSDAVKKAYLDKNLSPRQKYQAWETINKTTKKPKKQNSKKRFTGFDNLFDVAGGGISFLAEYGLWLLLAVVLSWIIWKSADWMPWFKGKATAKRELDELTENEVLDLDTLPSNLSNVVRGLWAQQPRAALALLYRGSVEKLADRLGTPFPPGATEAECVRRSRKLAQPESEASFQKVVRAWQAAAYAHRLPNADEFEALLGEWSIRWEKGA